MKEDVSPPRPPSNEGTNRDGASVTAGMASGEGGRDARLPSARLSDEALLLRAPPLLPLLAAAPRLAAAAACGLSPPAPAVSEMRQHLRAARPLVNVREVDRLLAEGVQHGGQRARRVVRDEQHGRLVVA